MILDRARVEMRRLEGRKQERWEMRVVLKYLDVGNGKGKGSASRDPSVIYHGREDLSIQGWKGEGTLGYDSKARGQMKKETK